MDVPTYPKPLFITDAAINASPTLKDKADIVQNAIELAHALGIGLPKVAILSAVETINSKIRSTIDAAALCKVVAARTGPVTFQLYRLSRLAPAIRPVILRRECGPGFHSTRWCPEGGDDWRSVSHDAHRGLLDP
jgi:hypothetical protein